MAVKNQLLRRPQPKDDESMIGYLLRLSEANSYQSLSWILQLTKFAEYANGSYSFIYRGKDLTFLSELTGVSKCRLEKLMYRPVDVLSKRLYGKYEFFGQNIYSYIIRDRIPKVCSQCLNEDPYCRKVWELSPVTACPVHNCLLIENCPNCGAVINWNRKKVCYCRYCNFDWRQSVPQIVPEDEIRTVKHLYGLFNLPHGDSVPLPHVLGGLNVQDTLSAIFLILAQLQGFTDTKGKVLTKFFEDNNQFHIKLNKAVKVFEDFPNNFFEFLDFSKKQYEAKLQATKETRKIKWIRGWKLGFENFGTALFNQLKGEQFQFLHNAFRQYLDLQKLPPEIAAICTNTNISQIKENYLSASQTKRILRIPISEINQLADKGKLKAIVCYRNSRNRCFFIERKSVEKLKAELKNSLFMRDVAKFFGLSPLRIKQLTSEGLLQPVRSPRVSGMVYWVFSRSQVEGIYKDFTNLALPIDTEPTESNLMSFTQSTALLNRVGIKLTAFIRKVINGTIIPYYKNEDKRLSRFYFEKQKIKEIYIQSFKKKTNGAYTIIEASKRLGTAVDTVRSLIKSKLLTTTVAKVGSSSKLQLLLIIPEVLEAFNKTYIFTHEIASETGTQPGYIRKMLAKYDIHPINDYKKRKLPIYRRSEIAGIKLSKAPPKKYKIKYTPHCLTSLEAAKYLKLSSREFSKLVENGIIKPYRNSLKEKSSGSDSRLFSKQIIENYSKNPFPSFDLITTKIAAGILGLSASQFMDRYVYTKYRKPLTPALILGSKRIFRYFYIADVKALAVEEKELIRVDETAQILGVSIRIVGKLTCAGDLTPVVGPNIGGRQHNLYRRSDVIALHAKREAFKIKQIQTRKKPLGQISGNRHSKRNS